MRILGLNFVRHRPRISPVGALSALVGALMLGAAGLDYLETRAALVRAEASLERLQRGQRPAAARTSGTDQPRLSPPDVLEADRVMAQLQLPWGRLLDVLEAETTPSIALLSVDAQGTAGTLQVMGEAPAMGDILAYVRRLRGAALVRELALSGHEERTVGAARSVRFTLDVRWAVAP